MAGLKLYIKVPPLERVIPCRGEAFYFEYPYIKICTSASRLGI